MYELLLLIVFSGIVSGYFLSLIAPEELEQGQRYFEILRNILFGMFVYFLVQGLTHNTIISLILAVTVFCLTYRVPYFSAYYALSGLSIFFLINSGYLLIVCVILFVLGLTMASLYSSCYVKYEKIKQKKALIVNILKAYFWFLIIGWLPFIFSYF
ncbi:MAG: hypothetical protein ACQESF_05760 [Nanobdellota archaeon]